MIYTTLRTFAFSKLGMALAATLFATSASAASFSWDFQNQAFNADGRTFSDTATSGSPTPTIGLKAYYVTTDPLGNSLLTSNVFFSNQGTAGIGMTSPNEPGGAPQHAVDSISPNNEYIVIDAWNGGPSGTKLNWSSIEIGWGVDNWNSTSGTAQYYNQADLKLWATDTVPTTVSGLGTATYFSNLTTTANTAGNLDGLNGGVSLGSSRYLVIAANSNDAFKLKSIGATVPEPASIALIGLGLLGLGIARRRRAA